jgi:LuxR family maltose regulon positive regulatory protein
LDENDNEGRHFLAYLVESVHRATGKGIPRSRAIVEAKSAVDLRAVIAEMLEELRSLATPLRIVFDDFHVIENVEVEAAVKYLLKHAPAGIGFGFTSRSLPALGLASYRVSNRLLEINDTTLALTRDETAELLFKRLGFHLTEPALLQLQELSEGWAPLVQLFALSVDSESDVDAFLADFERGHSHLLDYLAEEVLDKLDDETRQVLARVACCVELMVIWRSKLAAVRELEKS